MKKTSYSEKVFNYLNENKFDLTSLLTEEDEENSGEASSPEDVHDSKDSGSDIEEPKESNESSENIKEPSEEEEDSESVVQAVKDQQLKAAADLKIKRADQLEKQKQERRPTEKLVADFITKGALTGEAYYNRVKGLQKFIFEDNSEEQVLDFENKISVPVLVNNTLDYIDKFDSMFDKPQYCYDVAVEQIIKYGGIDFEKILKDFDMQFHETYRKRFPSADESPVMSYVNNQNYKNAADAQKSG